MSKILQNTTIIREKHGIPVYRTNPSIPNADEISRTKRVQIGDTHKGFVVDNGTGEILGRGGAMAYEWEDVDKERFVKLYLAGLKQASGFRRRGLRCSRSSTRNCARRRAAIRCCSARTKARWHRPRSAGPARTAGEGIPVSQPL